MNIVLIFGIPIAVWYGMVRLGKSKGINKYIYHFTGGVLALLSMILVIGATVETPQNQQIAQADTPAAPADNAPQKEKAVHAIKVSARSLLVDYHRNEVAADNKYKGQILAVSGTVKSIEKDMFDNIDVLLWTGSEFEAAHATLDNADAAKAAKLERGQEIMLFCVGNGMIMGSPMLDGCRIVKTSPLPQ